MHIEGSCSRSTILVNENVRLLGMKLDNGERTHVFNITMYYGGYSGHGDGLIQMPPGKSAGNLFPQVSELRVDWFGVFPSGMT